MGAVRCSSHGHQIGGPMACRHLSADIWGGVATRPFRECHGDFFDDGTMMLDVAICMDCVARFSIPAGSVANSQILQSIDPVPVCPECWHKLSMQRSDPGNDA
jgi:hypothetical protein